jgi:hypothetical protein
LLPGSIKPLKDVRAEISERLSEERDHRALASFLALYRREWTAKTSCHAGFVVQKCAQYRGQLLPEASAKTLFG